VQIIMVFEAEFLRSPGAAGLQVLTRVLLETRKLIKFFDGSSGCFGDSGGWAAIHRLEVVPVDAHIDY
jgi:hypothetical protein